MTLGELWEEWGQDHADIPLVYDLNGEGFMPVCSAIDSADEDGKVLVLSNIRETLNYGDIQGRRAD